MKNAIYAIAITAITVVIIWALYNIVYTQDFLALAWTKWVAFTVWLKNLLGLAV